MGAIYKVRHRLLDEIRVVKVMRPQIADSEDLQRRFAREARAAIRLKHPNIAQLYDFAVEADGVAYMVMEFIDGVTLQEMLAKNGPAPLDLTLEIARQGLEALRLPARARLRPSRRRARQPDADQGLRRSAPGQADRPRHRQAPGGRRRGTHRDRHVPGQGPLLLAGAVLGREGRRRPAQRPLLLRRDALRAAHRHVARSSARTSRSWSPPICSSRRSPSTRPIPKASSPRRSAPRSCARSRRRPPSASARRRSSRTCWCAIARRRT